MNSLMLRDQIDSGPLVGTAIAGGYLAGFIKNGDDTFALIVSPKTEGELTGRWNTTTGRVAGAESLSGGYANTKAMAAAGSALAQAALALSIAGYDDWYIASRDELELIYRNLKPSTQRNYALSDGENNNSVPPGAKYTKTVPAQTAVAAFREGGAEAMATGWYWSSTQYAANPSDAWFQYFYNGLQSYDRKSYEGRARAIRRVKIQSFDNLDLKVTPTCTMPSPEAYANVIAELQKAERIIIAMLCNMTDEQQDKAHQKLMSEGVSEEGMTRFHERRAALAAVGAP